MPRRTKFLAAAIAAFVVGTIAARLPSTGPLPRGPELAADAPARVERPAATDHAPTERTKTAARRAPQPKRVGELVAVTSSERRVGTTVERPEAGSSGGRTPSSGGSSPRSTSTPSDLERMYPEQWSATQVEGSPATFHWAFIVGIGDYVSAADTYGSRQDAQALKGHLRDLGWRSDHIILMTDRRATAKHIIQGIRWLARKADRRSTVIFHYAGHEKPLRNDPDRDGERLDVALWATDNRLILDRDLGRELGRVRAQKMWVHFATCRAGGFDDPGMSKAGRVITYSSPVTELSYEDPELRHSVFGWHTIVRGMKDRRADADGDGRVSVEESFRYAKPRVERHTSGNQHPKLVDRYDGGFSLRVPPKPSGGGGSTPAPTPTCDELICPPAARREQ